ncbi:MAG: hypothetical protein WCO00_06090 [Rhodospirillaceae bacterium]
MKPIKLIDGILTLRRALECDLSINALSNFYYKTLAETDNDTVIFCFEGYKSKQPRMDLYPIYKANRVPAAESIWKFIELFKKLLRFTPAIQVSVPYREADDVIAWFCQKFHTETALYIETNDYDLKQLELYGNVSSAIPDKAHLPPQYVRMYKTLVGDSSDNIKGVKGFGEVAFSAIDKDAVNDWLHAGARLPIPFTIPVKSQKWILENTAELKVMWEITGFLPIREDDINKNMIIGKHMPSEAEKILREVML